MTAIQDLEFRWNAQPKWAVFVPPLQGLGTLLFKHPGRRFAVPWADMLWPFRLDTPLPKATLARLLGTKSRYSTKTCFLHFFAQIYVARPKKPLQPPLI